MRNYNTTNHMAYPRVTRIEIDYNEQGEPFIIYTEQMAIVDGSGKVCHLKGEATKHRLDLTQIAQPVQVVHPATGEDIVGMTATRQQVELSMLAFVRADQKRRDAEV